MEKAELVNKKLNTDEQFVVAPMLIRTLEAGGFLRANGSFLAKVGFSEAELAEKPFLYWINQNDKKIATSTIEGKQSNCWIDHRTKDGGDLPLKIRVVENNDESLILGFSVEETELINDPEDSEDEATVRGTLHTIARIIEEQNPGYKCSILLVADGRFVRGAGPSLPEDYNTAIDGYAIGPTVGSCGTAIYWNVPIIVEDIQADPLWSPFAELAKKAGVAACWSYPFSSRTGNVLGALAFYSPVPQMPSAEQLGRLKAAARMAGLAVERGRAEEALLESKQKYQSMVDNIGIGVALISPNMEVLDLNKQMQKWFPDVVPGVGAICYRVFNNPPSDRICAYCPTCKTLQDGQVHESITETPTGGSIRNFRIVSSPILSKNGRVKAAIEMVEDITQKLQLEANLKHRQMMESIGNLAGGIAHDFNNILSSVIGFTELSLEKAEKGSILEDNLQEVYSAGKRAKELVRQILAFARQSEDDVQPLQPSVIAKEVLKFMRSSIPTSIEIKQTIHSNSLVTGNSTQIYQVFMNLFTNAAFAMEDDGGLLEFSMDDISITPGSSSLKAGDYIHIKVSDTGTGIPFDIIHSIFEPYFTTKRQGEGTGLGLAMVKGIIETYGGDITVDSSPGKGCTFNVYLPITKKRKPDHSFSHETLPRGTERILFVDDEVSIAKMGKRTLDELGYAVETRTDSIEALELFKSKPKDFDLIISDVTMPKMTGDVLAIELMAIRPDIRVILCTGYSKKVTGETASEIGIKAFVNKPIVKADLAKTVRKVLDDAKS